MLGQVKLRHRLKPVPPSCPTQLRGLLILVTAPAVYAKACAAGAKALDPDVIVGTTEVVP
jgi:hypothetical protein